MKPNRIMAENVALMKALERAREYIEMDATNQKYPLAIEVMKVIDDALAGRTPTIME